MLLFCFLLLFLQAKKTINLLEKKRKHLILQTYFHPLLSSALLARLLVVFAELAATASAICSTQVRKGSRIRNTWVRHFYPCGMGSYEISRKKEEGRGVLLTPKLGLSPIGRARRRQWAPSWQ